MIDDEPDAHAHGISDPVARFGPTFFNGRLNKIDQRPNMAFEVAPLNRGRDGATVFMAEHDHQGNVQMLCAIFETAQLSVARNVAGDADDEEISEALIEDDLRRHA